MSIIMQQRSFDFNKSLEEFPHLVGQKIVSIDLDVNYPTVQVRHLKCWQHGKLYTPKPVQLQLCDNAVNLIVITPNGAVQQRVQTKDENSQQEEFLVLSTIDCENGRIIYRQDTCRLQHFLCPYDCIVAADGTGDFKSLTPDLFADYRTIYVKNGHYDIQGVLSIVGNDVSLIGESREGVVLRFNQDPHNKIVVGEPKVQIYNGGGTFQGSKRMVKGNGTTFQCAPSPVKKRDVIVLEDGQVVKITGCINDTELSTEDESCFDKTSTVIQTAYQNIQFRNLTLTDGVSPLQVYQAVHCTLTNITFKRCSNSVRFIRSHHVTVRNLRFENCYNCVEFSASTNGSVDCCFFQRSHEAAVRFIDGLYLSVTNSRLTDSTKYGFVVVDSRQVRVQNCQLENCQSTALLFQGGIHTVTIADNQITNSGSHGIQIDGMNNNYGEITNNTLRNCNGVGIRSRLHETIIRDNCIVNNKDDGIVLHSGVESVYVVHNTLLNGSAAGIRIQGTRSPSLLIKNNCFHANQETDIVGDH